MRTVGIKALKNKLSAYVRFATAGETVLVTDGNTVVAELVPPQPGRNQMLADEKLADLVRKGWLTPPTVTTTELPRRVPVAQLEDIMRELQEDRDGR